MAATPSSRPPSIRLRIPSHELVPLLHQLEMQLRAGVTADAALALLAEEIPPGSMRSLLHAIATDVARGVTIHDACARFPRTFPPHLAAVIAAGEISARLPESLHNLAEHLAQEEEVRRTAFRALIYPTLVLAATVVLVGFLVGSVVPKFAEIFVAMHLPLPPLTQALIATSDFATRHARGFLFIGGAAALLSCLAPYLPTLRHARDALLLRLPFFGEIVRCLATARFAAHCRLLHDAGIPLLRALESAAPLVNHATLAAQLLAAREQLAAGAALHAALPPQHDFPRFMLPALRAGETTGRLTEALRLIETYAAQRAKHRLATFLALLEPALLTGLTLFVGAIALSFFLPLFSLLGGVNAH